MPLSPGSTTPQLVCSATRLKFGYVAVGHSQTQLVVLTNNGPTGVILSAIRVSSAEFSVSVAQPPVALAAGKSVGLNVTFTPSTTAWFDQTVTFTSNASNPSLLLTVVGTGVKTEVVGAQPPSLSFGQVAVGTRARLPVVLTNNSAGKQTVTGFQAVGSEFSISDPPPSVTLGPGQSITVDVTFSPQGSGLAGGSLFVLGPYLNVPVSGTGKKIGQLMVAPTTLGLGSVVVGTSGTASGSLKASGASVKVTAASTNNSVFSVGGLSLPVTIPAGQSTSFSVTFSPLVSVVASATLTFTSSAQPTTTTETLTGTGTPPPTHTVNLSWNASTSSNISGYNIYRAVYASSCGSLSKINTLLNTGTLYTDAMVADGTSYCYATTAVNTSHEESGYSSIVSNVQIPAP